MGRNSILFGYLADFQPAFSLPAVRRAYGRIQRIASRVIGAVIGMFALRLIYEGMTHR